MYKTESFDVGESFFRVGCSCVPEDFLDLESNDDGHWFLPHVVNLAFACELFLKSLLSDGDSMFFGHNLADLFSKLDESIKHEILHSTSFDGDERFLLKLTENAQCYDEWRYIFEHSKHKVIDIVFLENLADELHFLAKKHLTEISPTKED